jgi:hypothetical protein
MKRVLKKFLQLVSDFIEATRNSSFDFLLKKTAKKYKYLVSNGGVDVKWSGGLLVLKLH